MSEKRIDINVGNSIGAGLGTALAVVISYTAWQSIGWAIIHGFFGWFYVLYYIITYGG